MERKNTFQLVEENYDVKSDLLKLHNLFEKGHYFNQYRNEYTFKQLLDQILLKKWQFRGTCLNTDEYLKMANAAYFYKIIKHKFLLHKSI